MIFFSVIIPTYNRAKLITETIDSVRAQTFPHFEIILVDDGSTDDTGKLIQQHFGQEDRIRYFYKPNEERAAARNFGLRQARGDYAVFFDSDDIMQPHYLATLQSIIAEYPGVKLLAAKYNYTNNGQTEYHPQLNSLAEGWYGQELFLTGNILACNYAIKRKDHHFSYFPPDRELASMEDWLFLLENLAGNKIFIKDEICVTMRQHEERSMQNNRQVIEARKKATEWVLNYIDLSPSNKKKLIAWSHYFCGIHQYLDHKRQAAIKEAVKAIRKGGLNRSFLLLLVKSVVGRKLIKTIT